MNESYKEYLHGKSVAIVGPAAHMIGGGKGDEIDSHDVVVRVNREVIVTGPGREDRGRRADVLYSCFYPHESGGIGEDACDLDIIAETGFDWIVGIQLVGKRIRPQRLVDLKIQKARSMNMNACKVSLETASLAQVMCKGKPNTGTLALFDLALSSASLVTVYGLTFFQTPYEKGYRGDQHILEKVQSHHRKSSHASASDQLHGFRRVLRDSNVAFNFDEPLRAIMEG